MHTHLDDRGYSSMSVFDHVAGIPGQVNVSAMFPGAVKAWHRHFLQDDYWCVVRGDLKVGLYNTDAETRVVELLHAGAAPGTDRNTRIEVPPKSGKAVFLGAHRPGVLHIPAGLWHGGVAIGGTEGLLLYYVTRKYDAKQPDEERAEWNAFDFEWAPEFK